MIGREISFMSPWNELKSICTTFLETIWRFQNLAALSEHLQQAYQSESDQILQKVRKGFIAEIKSAFQQFVKDKKYAKILVLSTIFTTLIELCIIWPFGLNSNTPKIPFSSPLTVVWLNKSHTIC